MMTPSMFLMLEEILLAIALFAAVVLSVFYLVVEMSYVAERAESNRRSIRVASRHD